MQTDPLTLRLPPGMRDRLKRAASDSRRSMNSHAVHLLDAGMAAQEKGPAEAATSPDHDQNHTRQDGGIDA